MLFLALTFNHLQEKTVHDYNNPHCNTQSNQCYTSTYYDCNPYQCNGYECNCGFNFVGIKINCKTCYHTCYHTCETKHYYKHNCDQCYREWQEVATTAQRGPDSCAGQVSTLCNNFEELSKSSCQSSLFLSL